MESHTIKTQENLNGVTQKKKKKRIKSDSGHFQWMKAFTEQKYRVVF